MSEASLRSETALQEVGFYTRYPPQKVRVNRIAEIEVTDAATLAERFVALIEHPGDAAQSLRSAISLANGRYERSFTALRAMLGR